MQVLSFTQFNENMQDPPEEYIKTALQKLKRKIDKIFEEKPSEDSDKVLSLRQAREKGIEKSKKDKDISLLDLGVRLESNEMSLGSSLYDSLTIKFSEPNGNWYSLYVTIPLKDAISNDKEKEYSVDNVKYCSIKFKKYNEDNEVVGQIGPKKVQIENIDENFLVELKIELDSEFDDDQDDLVLED